MGNLGATVHVGTKRNSSAEEQAFYLPGKFAADGVFWDRTQMYFFFVHKSGNILLGLHRNQNQETGRNYGTGKAGSHKIHLNKKEVTYF